MKHSFISWSLYGIGCLFFAWAAFLNEGPFGFLFIMGSAFMFAALCRFLAWMSGGS